MACIAAALSSTLATTPHLDLTTHWVGIAALGIFALAYTLVMMEGVLHLRKSKPVVVAAGLIWILIALAYARAGDSSTAAAAVRANLTEFGELFLFILAAMTYVNTMEERQLFDALRSWLVRKRLTLRAVFWITGVLTFFLSAVLDNLTTALVMGTVVITVGRKDLRFVGAACVNVVVAANAGGAFSPFGDITTLMVWQAGQVPFFGFFALFVPSVVNWIIPAVIMSLTLPSGRPDADAEPVEIRPGGIAIAGLFGVTIALAVSFHSFLHLPPVLGMMTGLGLLKVYSYFLQRWSVRRGISVHEDGPMAALGGGDTAGVGSFDIFHILQRAEWDTLMFFYGIILSVGGLATIGYLSLLSDSIYTGLGATVANVLVGVISAVVDNIPVMFSVLSMDPAMSHPEWLLVTLTAGVGGSLLPIGSAAGVALLGQSRGIYTFADHLRWSWAIALGYVASIGVHLMMH